jgi:spermidine/putrescine transport system substrate-binding protein
MLGAAPALLAACGGASTAPAETVAPGTTQAGTGQGTTTTAATSAAQVPAATGAIDLLSWEGYDLPGPMKAWKSANGVEVHAAYIASHDDIQAKIQAGGAKGLDLITYGPHYSAYYRELGILTPLDEAKIPNLANLMPFFASDVENAWIAPDGTRTGVPWTWGALGISYDSTVITEPPTSYDVFFEPKYKDKVGVFDDPSGSYAFAANVLGLNVSKMTEADFKTITDWLKRLVKQTKGIAPSFGDWVSQFVSGEIILGFNGWAAVKSFAEQAGKKGIETVWPDEPGGYTFVDAWAIPPEADNPDTAYAWINETLEPAVNAAAAESLVGGVTVEGAAELLPGWLKGLFPYDDLDEFFDRAPLQNNPPIHSDEYVTLDRLLETWQEVKLSA